MLTALLVVERSHSQEDQVLIWTSIMDAFLVDNHITSQDFLEF